LHTRILSYLIRHIGYWSHSHQQ